MVQGIHTSQGELKWISVNAQPIRENGVLKGVVVSLSDITPTKRLEARLRQEAYHDDLTGLFNRRYLTTELARAVNSARRHGHPISLCLCDLDHFKVVNDTFGHGSGDRALQAFAETILLELRQDELAARFGGDEFCILYAHSEAAQAARSLQRILANLNELTVAAEDGRPFRLAASFGIADLEAAHQDHEDFLEAADRALYAAKAAGRNRVHVLSRS